MSPRRLVPLLCCAAVAAVALPAVLVCECRAGDPAIPPAERTKEGALVHRVRSEHQLGETLVKVLLPDRPEAARRYPALYVLPVEAGEERRYGDALTEVKKHDLHNKHGVICVFPTFAQLPWYADHPADPRVRQERYFLEVVAPLVERHYPVQAGRDGRLLVGFSKSGWGAFSLLLRHPDRFGMAAAWDAPMMEAAPERFGMGTVFGTQENFEKYRIAALLARRGGELGPRPRLVLLGYGNFRDAHAAAHDRMTALGVPHVYRDGPPRKHDWHSGWLPEAFELLNASRKGLEKNERGSGAARPGGKP